MKKTNNMFRLVSDKDYDRNMNAIIAYYKIISCKDHRSDLRGKSKREEVRS